METRCKVFTPLDVANQMLDLVGFMGDVYGKRIVENSCGEGNILYAIVARYIDSLKGQSTEYIRQGLEHDIIGFDIDEDCCEKAKAKLDELANEYGIINVKWNIACIDTLLLKVDQEYDFVVGNPPYISYRDLDTQRREYLRENFNSCKVGAFDYCYAFIEHGLTSLKPDGKMIYLIPSSIFKNVHGKKLRELMLDNLTAIYDYTSIKLFGKILTSSALIICNKNCRCNCIHYEDIAAKNNRDIPKATPYNGVQEIRHVSKWINGEKNNQISCVKASQIRQSGKACRPESGLPTRTSYSVWRFAFADLGIGSFGIEAAA